MIKETTPSSTTLPSRWLLPARVGWIFVALGCITLFIIGTVNTTRLPLPSCAPPATCPLSTLVSREDAEIAAGMGLPFPLLPLSLAFSITARLSLAVVGLLIFWRRSDDWVAMLISGGLMSVLLEGVQGVNPSLLALQGVLFGIGTALFLPIPFIFPSGHFEPRWMRWPVIAITLAYAVLVAFFLETSQFANLSAVLTLLWVAFAVYAMPYRYFRVASPVERQQIKWVLLGLSATFISGIYYPTVSALYPVSEPSQTRIVLLLINLPLYVACYGFFAFSMLVAMLRYRLWDIDVIIRRTLQYTLLTGLLALVYFGSVVVLQNVFVGVTGQQSQVVVVVSTLAIAALFTPLRRRVQAFIDQRFFRKKYNAEQTLARFAIVARDEVDMDKLTTALLGVVQETMQPEKVSLWLAREKGGRIKNESRTYADITQITENSPPNPPILGGIQFLPPELGG